MVLLHEEKFLLVSLNLCLQLQPDDIGDISDFSELTDVTLHRLAHGQLYLIPDLKSSAARWTLSICRTMRALSTEFAKI